MTSMKIFQFSRTPTPCPCTSEIILPPSPWRPILNERTSPNDTVHVNERIQNKKTARHIQIATRSVVRFSP